MNPNLRYHAKSCYSCRYYRRHTTGASSSLCLLLGRDLAAQSTTDALFIFYVDRSRVCDLWKMRPKSWVVYSRGTSTNPFFHDPYIPRDMQQRLRKRRGLK